MKPFTLDVNDPYQVHHIIGDINDHLLDQGLDGDAQNFIFEVQGYKPEKDLDEILEIAFQYVDIEDVSDARHPSIDRSTEDDEGDERPKSWDAEADAVKRMLNDSNELHAPYASSGPVDLTVPEFPELSVEWDFEAPLEENMKAVLLEISSLRDPKALRSFLQDWRGLRAHTWTYKAMFQLAWSYVRIYPNPEQYGDIDW